MRKRVDNPKTFSTTLSSACVATLAKLSVSLSKAEGRRAAMPKGEVIERAVALLDKTAGKVTVKGG